MKPFDLEAAKAGKPLVMRNGEVVTYVAHIPTCQHANSRLLAVTKDGNLRFYYENGDFFTQQEHPFDLFMAPVKKTVWVNLYKTKLGKFVPHVHINEDYANRAAGSLDTRVGKRAWPLEIEE